MKTVLNHVALLLPSAERASEILRPLGAKMNPAAQWEGEGTLEIYVGDLDSQMASLLLMEPIQEGAYSHAMKKRGPGLHHLAIDVLHMEDFLDSIASSGWLLHPRSVKMIRQSKTAYLARPGIPTLIEVQEREELKTHRPLVEEIRIPHLQAKELQMFQTLGLSQILASATPELELTLAGNKVAFSSLL
ncbi:MAG: hypothetical protein JSU04_11035 [Bdellovibrionales bacterium]|nr:hypothetical protein [Bdellovibrionales bacterium]